MAASAGRRRRHRNISGWCAIPRRFLLTVAKSATTKSATTKSATTQPAAVN